MRFTWSVRADGGDRSAVSPQSSARPEIGAGSPAASRIPGEWVNDIEEGCKATEPVVLGSMVTILKAGEPPRCCIPDMGC